MRKLIYLLTDGNKVNSWGEAVASGQDFEVKFEDIPEPTPEPLPKQKANRKAVKAH
jgi:hypothetical protein